MSAVRPTQLRRTVTLAEINALRKPTFELFSIGTHGCISQDVYDTLEEAIENAPKVFRGDQFAVHEWDATSEQSFLRVYQVKEKKPVWDYRLQRSITPKFAVEIACLPGFDRPNPPRTEMFSNGEKRSMREISGWGDQPLDNQAEGL
jgi:hypothetical protein